MAPRIKTSLTELLGIETPVMLAGMGGISGKELVAAVSNAGGFGCWGSAISVKNKEPAELKAEIEEIRTLCNGKPFGIDILVHGHDGGVMHQLIDIFADGGAKAFVSGRGYPKREVIDQFHKRGMLVGCVCGRVKHATGAVEAGVDFVIVQGYEAGGHTGDVALSALLPQVVDAIGSRVPVVAAGGIFDGRGLASALSYGAAGVWVGTRFLMTDEAYTHPLYKEHLCKVSTDETRITRALTGAPLRVLDNKWIRYYDEHPDKIKPGMQSAISLKEGCWQLHAGIDGDISKVKPEEVDMSIQVFVAGQCIGAITKVLPAAEVVREMTEGALAIIERLNKLKLNSRL